jgi:hypothetical protein
MTRVSVMAYRDLQTWALLLAIGGLASFERNTPGVDDFMSYDEARRTVQLSVAAHYDDSNTGYNLNGGFRGSHRITVPVGWRVRVTFVNRDVVQHSLGVVRQGKLVPIRLEKPAFAGAATRAVMAGIPANERDEFEFAASQTGPYLLACGVPGHAAIGSYLRFVISADAARPAYETERLIARGSAGDGTGR